MRFRDQMARGIVLSPDEPPAGSVSPITDPPLDTPAGQQIAAAQPDIAAMVNAEVDRRLAAMQPQQPVQQAADPSTLAPYERAKAEAERLGIWDQEKITGMAIAFGVEDAKREIMGAVAPAIQQIHRDKTMLELTRGLGDKATEYLNQLAPGLDPASLTPQVRDLLTRAARDYEREKTPAEVSITPEPTGGANPGYTATAEDRSDLAQMQRIDPTLTEEDLVAAKSLSDRAPLGQFGGLA